MIGNQSMRIIRLLSVFILMIIGYSLILGRSGYITSISFFQFVQQFVRPGISNIGESIVGLFLFLFAILLLIRDGQLKKSSCTINIFPDGKNPILFEIGSMLIVVTFSGFCYLISQKMYLWFFPYIWLLIIICMGLLIRDYEHSTLKISQFFDKQDLVSIIFLVFASLFIVSFRINNIPDTILGDEAAFFSTAYNIVKGQVKETIFDSGVYTFPIISSYYQSLFLSLFGFTIFAWRLSTVVISVLSLIPVYLFVKIWLGRRMAFLTVIFQLFLPYFLAFSRLGYDNVYPVFFVSLVMLSLHLALKLGNRLNWYLVGVCCGLSFYTYSAGQVSMVIVPLYIFYLFIAKRLNLKATVKVGLLLLLGFGLVYFPYLIRNMAVNPIAVSHKWAESIFLNRWNIEVYYPDLLPQKNLHGWKVGGITLFYEGELVVRLLLRGLIRTSLIFFHPKIIDAHYIVGSLTGNFWFFYLLGWMIVLRGLLIKDDRFVLLTIWFFACFFFLSALNVIGARWTHMTPIMPVIAIMSALGIRELAKMFYKNIIINKFWVVSVVFFGMVTIYVNLYSYFIQAPRVYKADFGAFYPLTSMRQFGASVNGADDK